MTNNISINDKTSNKYDFKTTESVCNEIWQEKAIYHFDEDLEHEERFVIDTPPPTVSGSLHIGHVYSYVQTDFIARFKRMQGMNVFYPMGFDDNGLPTERLVEKTENIRAHHMQTREEFIEICKKVVVKSEEEFRILFKTLGLSVDWSREYQTISDDSVALSQASFLDLIQKNLAYRALEPNLWDVVDQTALAQADIVDKEQDTFMNDIIFTTIGGEKYVISTTRPELLPACVSVFCNPDDSRYQHLIGDYLYSPLFEVKLPVIADDKVDIAKGSGLVMCATFGDQTDIFWWRTHKLPLRVILSQEGRIKDIDFSDISRSAKSAKEHMQSLVGLKIKEARTKIIQILQDNQLLKNQEKITNVVKCAERSGAPLEILVIPQWNIKLLEHKQELLNKSKECAFHPEYMRVRLENWIENLQWDWCISRQRFFGVPFPVWYSKREGEEGKILYADFDQLPINPLKHLPRGYQAHEVEADKDVMDTWATSSITPQLNSKAISDSFVIDRNMHKKLFPADLRPQGHEIIRTWAFYTIAKSYFHENSIPWKNLMISGWCLAQDKSKMSKSKGNVVTPNRMLQEHGADVIRYWASTSKLGSDIIYSDEAFKIAKKLINKLYNAGNFLLLHLDTNKLFNTTASDDISKQIIYAEIDLWFITKINQLITKVNEELNKFEYFSARSAVEKFFWSDFCDYYMEITKVRVYNQRRVSDKEKDSAVHTLYHSLNAILKLFAPYIPYITEHLYQRINKNESIHAKNTWPRLSDFPVSSFDKQAELLINIVDAVRKFKTEQQLSLNASIETVTLYGADLPNSMIQDLKDVCNITDVISEASLSSQGETENVILVGDECYLKIIGQ